jgi:hypothetical protein
MNLTRFKTRMVFVAVVFFLVSSIALGQEEKPIETDLCSLIAHPKQFNKKRVRVNARVESAMIEGGHGLRILLVNRMELSYQCPILSVLTRKNIPTLKPWMTPFDCKEILGQLGR